jgi:hypothetical protein
MDALHSFDELYNNMPFADVTFNVSKRSVINRLCSERITKMNVIWNFLNADKMGLNYDIRKEIYDKVPAMTLNDINEFTSGFLKNRTKTYLVLGKETETDFNGLEKLGSVTRLSPEEIFGY